MKIELIRSLDKLISEGEKLRLQAGDLFGTKQNLIDDSEYTSWRIRSLDAISRVGKSGETSYVEIIADDNFQFSYDYNVEKILGHLKASLDIANSNYEKDIVTESTKLRNNIFIVHGHDEAAKEKVARFLESLQLNPIILHEKPNKGRTLIEKILDHSEEVDFAIAILTPDDNGYSKKTPEKIENRARQNVIFELGLFIGVLGRHKVVALKTDRVENPSDYDGVVYIHFDDNEGWKIKLAKELKEIFNFIDLNKIA